MGVLRIGQKCRKDGDCESLTCSDDQMPSGCSPALMLGRPLPPLHFLHPLLSTYIVLLAKHRAFVVLGFPRFHLKQFAIHKVGVLDNAGVQQQHANPVTFAVYVQGMYHPHQ